MELICYLQKGLDLKHNMLEAWGPLDYCWLGTMVDQFSRSCRCVIDGLLKTCYVSCLQLNCYVSCHKYPKRDCFFFSFYLCLIVNQKASSCWLCEESWVKLEITTLSVCTACTLARHWPHFRAEWDLLISVYAACLEYSQWASSQDAVSQHKKCWVECMDRVLMLKAC